MSHDTLRDAARLIPHAARCSRPTPTYRAAWNGTAEVHCPACGRTAPAPDPEGTHR